MCWKPKEVSYDIGFQCLLGFHFEGGQNFDLPKSLIQSKPKISSSHRQLSEIITQSLVRLRHMNSRRKAEEVSYDANVQNAYLLHHWSYRGVQIIVRKMRKSPMTFLFNSRSDSYPHRHHICISWPLFTVKSELTSVTEIFIFEVVSGFKHGLLHDVSVSCNSPKPKLIIGWNMIYLPCSKCPLWQISSPQNSNVESLA
jgi:hypothetical protein